MFQIRHETSKNTRGQGEGDFTAKPKIFCIREDDRSNIGLSKALQIFLRNVFVCFRKGITRQWNSRFQKSTEKT